MTRTALMLCGLLACALPASAAEPRPPVWLGVYLVDEVDGGVRVRAVVPDSPAAIAGLRSGDLLLEVDSRAIPNQEQLEKLLAGSTPGDPLELVGLRGERTLRVRLVPVLAPAPPEAPRASSWTVPLARRAIRGTLAGERGESGGLQLAEIGPELRKHYGAPEDRGVLVLRVAEDGPAARAGIRVGDVLVEMDGVPIDRRARVLPVLAVRHGRGGFTAHVVRAGKKLALPWPEAAAPSAAPLPTPFAPPAADEGRLRDEIERLERRLEELRQRLEKVSPEGDGR